MNAVLRMGDRWGLAEASDRRFRRICALVLPSLFAILLLLPQGPWPQAPREAPPEPMRVQILPPPPPPPPPVRAIEKPVVPAQKPAAARPAPAQQPPAPSRPSARAVAEQAGMADIRRQLAALQAGDASSATGQQPLLQEVALSQGRVVATGAQWNADAGRGSGGIGASQRGVAAVQGRSALGARRTGEVRSSLASASGAAAGGDGTSNSSVAGRSLQEIQLAFDRSKTAFFSIFNRAARERAGMSAGQIVVSLTIAPDGSVTRCELVASSFSDPELEQKILQRVKLLNFGAKDVPAYTYPNYPIQFLPS